MKVMKNEFATLLMNSLGQKNIFVFAVSPRITQTFLLECIKVINHLVKNVNVKKSK